MSYQEQPLQNDTDTFHETGLEIMLTLRQYADRFRNPNTERLLEIASEYSSLLEKEALDCHAVLGGSLVSNTCLAGHQDIDLKLLVPEGQDDEKGIRLVSEKIGHIVPFQKVRPYGGEEEQSVFALVHQCDINDEIAGDAELEVQILPARVYVGYAKYQSQLPQWMLDAYVIAKAEALAGGNKEEYKSVKQRMYAMTRSLYREGYFT